jgi:Holliday junction DNA helicase RuvB
MIENDKLTSKHLLEGDNEVSLRPLKIADFVGQEQIKANLSIFISSAIEREEALDHTILYGPPGLGKTTIAQIIAKEMGVNFKASSGPILSKAADLAAILTNLQKNDILFIDEIHRLNISVEEVLYSALEDFVLDIIIGEGPTARSVRINLPRFTLVGATTRIGLISNPLRDRFGIPLRLDFYNVKELIQVLLRGSKILKIDLREDGAGEIAKRSRGTPRIALRLLKRVRDLATVQKKKYVDADLARDSLTTLEVDEVGLDSNDFRYLQFIAENYFENPVGLDTIAAGLYEQKDTIEETIEPYLIQLGFIQRTPRGRLLTQKAFSHLNRYRV